MTEIDTEWTPEAAYRLLHDAITSFIAGDITATRLYDWLTGTFAVPTGTSPIHRAQCLYRLALIDTAIFLQCDLPRSDLAESLQGDITIVESGRIGGLTRITRSPCFIELMRNRQIPAALIDLTAKNAHERLESEGFREI